MMELPAGATPESHERLAVARRLSANLPPELGKEIAVTGSTARGVADRHSDIELNCWVDDIPDTDAWRSWLIAAGATHIGSRLWPADAGGFYWVTCRFENVWFEIGWSRLEEFTALLQQLLQGKIRGHGQMVMGSMVSQAVVLRTDGLLPAWREALRDYPDSLRAAIIAANTTVWSDPHVPGVRWALADRGERFALAMRLQWDVQNLLAVLWAINRRWEQDWKWTDDRALQLPIAPPQVSERINKIFDLSDPERSVRTAFGLIDEVLQLVPRGFDVSTALENIRRARRDELIARYHRACAAILRDGAIIMVYMVHRDHAHWSLPGGGVEAGESPEQAVIREVAEETGLVGKQPRLLYERPLPDGWESCFLLEVSPDQEPVLGVDPEVETTQQLAEVAWRPLYEVADNRQIAYVLAALAHDAEVESSD